MEKRLVSARLRPKKDDDIKEALCKLPIYYDESDIVREALRQFLFSHKGRTPKLLGSQIYTDDGNKDEIILESVEVLDNELDANLDKFIGE